MIDESTRLKLKIDRFCSNFLAKDDVIIFEENKFDIFIGIFFNTIKILFLPTINFLYKSIMKILDKFLDLITQQNELKKKILKQEKILINNTKLNSILSEQINKLNNKIDNISLNKYSPLEIESSNKILKNNHDTEINQVSNTDIGQISNLEVDFYQKENLRISNQLFETQKKFEIMKNEIEKFQNQRSNLIEKINSVNDAMKDSNIVTNVFENKSQINKINVQDPQLNHKETDLDLDAEVKKIFAKNN